MKTDSGAHFFKPRSGLQKLIINLMDINHGWNGTVVGVSGLWEATSKSDRGLVPLSWYVDSIFQVAKPISQEGKARALKLYEISYDRLN